MKSKAVDQKRVTRWSFSSWVQDAKCAYAYQQKFLLGLKEPEGGNPAIERGNLLHKKQENYLTGKIQGVPREFLPFKPEYQGLLRARPIVEKFWGVDPNWKPIEWNSWVVFKMDAAVLPTKHENVLWIQDLKTGKEYDTHEDQASLGACIGFALYPKVEEVQVEFWYADQGIIRNYTFDPKEIKKETKRWMEEGDKLLTPRKKYLPSPSDDNCRYCFVRSDKGGDCEAWKKLGQAARKGR